MCVVVDWNGSAAQLMPLDDLPAKWKAFGWEARVVDGHSEQELSQSLEEIDFQLKGTPHVIIAKTVKGKGVPMLEGHGPWHHRIPNQKEYKEIMGSLA